MTALPTPWKIVRVRGLNGVELDRKVWTHATTKTVAETLCEALNIFRTSELYYVVEPVGPSHDTTN